MDNADSFINSFNHKWHKLILTNSIFAFLSLFLIIFFNFILQFME